MKNLVSKPRPITSEGFALFTAKYPRASNILLKLTGLPLWRALERVRESSIHWQTFKFLVKAIDYLLCVGPDQTLIAYGNEKELIKCLVKGFLDLGYKRCPGSAGIGYIVKKALSSCEYILEFPKKTQGCHVQKELFPLDID